MMENQAEAAKLHKQVLIKVNAECDEGVAPVVIALNEIHGVITSDSCQEGVYGEAYVYFSYGKSWKELGTLLNEIASCLRENDFCCECLVRLEWLGDNDCPYGKLVFDISHMGNLASAIQNSTSKINRRMCELADGKECTELRS